MKIFERLYELKGRIDLESERLELMLGDGRLRWQGPEGEVDHPVLLQRVELEFDAEVPEIRLLDTDRAPELYTGILQGSTAMSPDVMTRLRHELEQAGFHPLNPEATTAFLRRIAQLVSPRGTFRGDATPIPVGADPVVSRDPALFLRQRMSGFPAAFDWVLEDLEHRGVVPIGLTRLVGVTPPPPAQEPLPPRSPWGEPPDVLLSKPANPEQVEIARALERHHAVLVQGPPGTGKSHTIANLIGHLVAHGKRILVTSHTTKALRLLRSQIVESLQPLSVAVLENDLTARAQMEGSVRAILARLTTDNDETLEREVGDLAATRAEMNAGIDDLTNQLREAREAEYLPILLGGESVPPADAARWVREHAAGNDWIPGPVEPGAPLPLSIDELVELYGLAARLSIGEEHEIEGGLPEPGVLPSPNQFSLLVGSLAATEPPEFMRLWDRPPAEEELPALEHLASIVSTATQELAGLEPWQVALVAAGHSGGSEQDLWLALKTQVLDAAGRWGKARPTLLEYAPEVKSTLPHEEMRRVAAAITTHLEGGGSLGVLTLLFHGKWKSLIRDCRVNGQPPTAVSHFRAIVTVLTIEEGRRKLAQRWGRQAEPIGLPTVAACGNPPEPALLEYANQFETLLGLWPRHWAAIKGALADAGMRWEAFRAQEVAKSGPTSPYHRDAAVLAGPLQQLIAARHNVAARHRALLRLDALARQLEPYRGPVCTSIVLAVTSGRPSDYEAAREQLLDLTGKGTPWQRRRNLLSRLEPAAPMWARAIRDRTGTSRGSSTPGDPTVAWRWRHLRQEIDRRAGLDEVALSARLHQRREELRDTTAKLIDRRAWLGQLRRTDLPARQALQGWAQTQKKIGKGTGKRVPELQRQARELLAKARYAVPVWIMPLDRVTESFDPRRGRFDVVIVDEASQSDVKGLLAWYLGDRVAIVGDHEQVSPLAVGQQLAPIQALIAQHLGGIPNAHLYDGTTSIYDLGRTCFGGTIALREHFRCVPDIIEFSNRLSYNGEIRPLRNPSSTPLPHTVEYVVSSRGPSDRTGKTNLLEAQTVAALLKAMTGLPTYDGKSFGAVTLLGDEQAGLIQDLTVSLVGAVELERRRFAAGNPGQFQGDERHVILLSMVDVPTGAPLRRRETELFKQRYNVAASRAKDQLWLVHSLDPDRDLHAGDLRRVLIEHMRAPSAKRSAVESAQSRAESPFEAAVIERLVNAGYRVEPQVWVGHYRIDMVVSDGANQVALECDGDRFHGVDQIPADMTRQAILERAGWRFVRVRGTRFFRDPEATTGWILSELTRLGVEPAGPDGRSVEADVEGQTLREAIVRRAHEVMREQNWLPSLTAPPAESPQAE